MNREWEGMASSFQAGTAGETCERDELLRGLAAAHEELRVADEEVRAQHEQIVALVRLQSAQGAAQDRLIAELPVPVVVTDVDGEIRAANVAAVVLARKPPTLVVGTPVFLLFARHERPALHDVLLRIRSGGGHETGRFVRATGDPVPVEVSASPRPGQSTVTWVLGASGTEPRVEGVLSLPAALARLAELPVETSTHEDFLRAAAAVCRDVLGPATEVTLQLGAPERPEVVASTGRLAQALDGAQLTTGQGPSGVTFASGDVVSVTDLGRDIRWPALASSLRDDVGAAVAVPLEAHGRIRGVLTAYRPVSRVSASLRESAELLGLTLGQLLQELDLHAEIRRAAGDLDRALSSRATIDQAKGIVMAHKGCTAEDAFEHLVDLASTQHVKVREVAQQIVDRVQAQGAARPG